MRTQVMREFVAGTPWLERDYVGGETERTLLTSLPFTIGRKDSVDLQVDSTQVSREHAVISRQGKKYKIKDLGSTNGTYVNGKQIEEAFLGDGDLVAIAEVEFTFFAGQTDEPRPVATEVMAESSTAPPPGDAAWDLVLAIRRAHQIVTQGGLRSRFQPIVELETSDIFGYEGLATTGAEDAASPRCELPGVTLDCRATERLRRLFRRTAAEDAAQLPAPDRLLLAVTANDAAASWFLDHLRQLQDLLTGRQLIVEIPEAMAGNGELYRRLLGELRHHRIQIALDGCVAGKEHDGQGELPDVLKFSPAVLRAAHRGDERQRHIEQLVHRCQESACLVIATGLDHESDLRIARALGCTLGQGEFLGRPQTVAALAGANRPRRRGRDSNG